MSIISRPNEIIGWMVRNYFKGDKCFKIHKNPNKTSYRSLYSGLDFIVEKWKLEFDFEIEEHTKKSDKIYKKVKKWQL